MKVLVLSHLYPAPGYDRHLFVHEQVLALRAQGVDVSVLSPTAYSPEALRRLSPHLRQRRVTPARAIRDGVVVEYPRVLVLPHRLLFDRTGDLYHVTLRRRVAALRAAGVELVHAHQAMPDGAAAARLAADLAVPYVVTVHGVDVYQHLRLGGRIAARTAEVLGRADAVAAVSHSVARLLESCVAADRLVVNHNGTVATPTGSPQSGAGSDVAGAAGLGDGRFILSAGYLIARKGHGTVLEALASLAAERGLDACPAFAIAGDGPLRGALAERAAQLGVAGRVHFLGRLPHDTVLSLMARADAFVLTSRDEAFGLVYTEAMAQGTPVIACRGEGPEDFVQDGVSGLLVPAGDASALADALRRLLDDPAGARAVGAAGRAAVEDLTWERNAQRQVEIYRRVLARRGATAA